MEIKYQCLSSLMIYMILQLFVDEEYVGNPTITCHGCYGKVTDPIVVGFRWLSFI